ncbi:cholinesterase-like isoform X3 [Mizuhopecten yessoensis]|uniref:cholinesterase-like isoform X2 n=1 Tax=Mizuhopecten yessoensis TaxID=6573 RepID=UPI000B45D070|nr:cholinesterase-like isoform X2 [Mizuhopecten yessoensis]XP_021362532.1 cholinesterase-like isoform X3 [Mizuhopecten yessoensis]
MLKTVVALDMWRFIYLIMVYIHQGTSNSVIRVSGGLISGVQLSTSQGHVMSFLGVQYAKAPIGKLRFQKPEVNVKWNGIQNATNLGPICMQSIRNDDLQLLEMSENCLFLNIYVPGDIDNANNDQLPVVVIVHPGNFQEGSGAMIDGKSISISNHAIVVTFNFRLGVFGFLSLKRTFPGNAGLLDQVALLQWVKQNIAHFNGNPKNVVLICDYFTSQKHISSTFHNLYEKIITFNDDYEVGNIEGTNAYFNSDDIKQRCASIGQSFNRCLLEFDPFILLNASTSSTGLRKRPLFWPVPDANFPEIAKRTISGGFVSLLNIADLILTDLPFLIRRNSHQNNCDVTDFDEISHHVVQLLAKDMDERSKLLMLKTLRTFYNTHPEDCSGGAKLLSDYRLSGVLSFANSYCTQSLTLLAIAEMSSSNELNINTTLMCVLTNCSTSVHSANQAFAQFIRYGYPTFADDRIVWRPYTQRSKNYLSISDSVLTTGDVKTWPFDRLELLWFDLLPSLGVKVTSSKVDNRNTEVHIPQNACITSYAEAQWGLSPSQLEALLFSLRLISWAHFL